ncbi:hypothetical protein BC360_28840 [Ensifer sp. LC163]|nr:hypothetical protein BC360_28840 [Ensifer sp. LC163]
MSIFEERLQVASRVKGRGGSWRKIWHWRISFCYKNGSDISDGSGVYAPETVFFCVGAAPKRRLVLDEGH